MASLADSTRARFADPETRKVIRYTLVSVISVLLTMVLLVICYGLFHIKGASSSIIASTIAAVPSYFLNRNWVWKKNGKSHFRKEVLPFWIMVVVGLAASAAASGGADSFAQSATDSHAVRTLIVAASSFCAFGILWVLKFVIFNKLMFVHRESDLDPALDGRAGLPT